MTDTADRCAAGLAEVLAEAGHGEPQVSIAGVASAGATRRTLFLEVLVGEQTIPAVAQISSASTLLGASTTVEDEAELVRIAEAAGVPVAQVLGASNHNDLVGGPVVITRRVDGVTIPRHVLRSLQGDAAAGERLTMQCGTALALLHAVDHTVVPASVPVLDPAGPAPAYVQQLSDTLDGLGTSHPALRYGIRWLGENVPSSPETPALLHGDFRNGNLIVSPAGLGAVLDWELAHIGDPMEDLAYLCMRHWRFGSELEAGGFGRIDTLRDAYVAAGGTWRDDAFSWWLTARTTWWGIGLAFQADNFSNGITTSIVHAASGRRVVELEYDLLTLIGSQS